MSVLNTPRFRLNRGRVMGLDLANVVTRKMVCKGDGKVPYFDIGTGATAGPDTSASTRLDPDSGEEHGLVLQNLHIKGSEGVETDIMIGGRLRDSSWRVHTLVNDPSPATTLATDVWQGDGDKSLAVAASDGAVFSSAHTFDTMLFFVKTPSDNDPVPVEEWTY